MTFVRQNDKQAQVMVSELSPPMSVENIQLNLKQKINTEGINIRGCSLLPDGRMVFSCNNSNTVRFINKEGIELFQIGKDKTRVNTYDTVYIKDNNSVVVSSGFKGCGYISIIDIESKKVMTTIYVDTNIDCMAVSGRTIYYCVGNNGLRMLNLSHQFISGIINIDIPYVNYVATFGDKLYYTKWNTHTVTRCDSYGTTQWRFRDTRVLQGPLGISVDNDGNVYVVGHISSNVVVISPDGQRHRELLSSKDGLTQPTVLDYDKSTNILLVVNQTSTAFLFDVTRGQYEKSRTIYTIK
jgi:hypothetical protein